MRPHQLRTELRGRQSECATLDALVGRVRAGASQVLVLRGEAGVGKSALLDYLANGPGQSCRVARAAGVESEVELPFSGLHQLCAPMLGHLDRLPGPQRDALATAFGMHVGPPPDRFLVGLAVLSLLAEVAEERPLVCVIDDAQWFDPISAQLLAFVARRQFADPVGLVFAIRSGHEDSELTGQPAMDVRGLRDADAHALLATVLTGDVDHRVRETIVAETRGNPLALLELPRGLSTAELSFGFGLADAVPLETHLEQGFSQRLAALPGPTRLFLLAAALEPVGDLGLLRRALQRLDVDYAAAVPAMRAGLIELSGRVRFRHPLVRSAVARAAEVTDLRAVHLALAEETDPELDPDRRAWHRAHAASGPDEEVAVELEGSADRARARGGLAAQAAFLERAIELTDDPARRPARILAAATARHQSGSSDKALALLADVETTPLDGLTRARVELLRAQIAFFSSRGRDAPPLLLSAARRMEALDEAAARDIYLDALAASLLVGRLAGEVGARDVARAARAAPSSTARPADLLLDGVAALITDGYAEGVPPVRRALKAWRADEVPIGDALRWLWLATHAAHDVWDDESWEVLSTRHLRLARQAGALAVLQIALNSRMGLHFFAGEFAEAAALVNELSTVNEVMANHLPPYGALALAAWQGRPEIVSGLTRSTYAEGGARGEGMGLTIVDYSSAVLHNGLGRYQEALRTAEQGAGYPDELGFSTWSLVELVEAAARSGHPDRAADALDELVRTTGASGTDWALGIEARSRAQVSQGGAAEGYYVEAVERLDRTRMRVEHARAQLLYGEWLRRENRRRDARRQLRSAYDLLSDMGSEAFAERARRELVAAGERLPRRSVEAREAFTAQEAQIARLAAEGRTNPEIGAELFLSPRTVEWHLHKVFAKLGIGSRRELSGTLLNA
ncbi:helix-turn-helix transcriptional regulator [Kribbella capetownensis]|uniref:Helix-turn-helix transcriptional regulator n=1 Tax=Kribbella capetownensis TaxID=1572659 RepID=A0A4R0JSL5_9ACTN|nr:LuxR family transcriptional regulator [Kribbella capetownensis]TCC49084.1 helix-turn-helix transcriptional regulator [Kribbella capetownensis]